MWEAVGVVSGSNGCVQCVGGSVGVVAGCDQWVVDILFTSMKYPYSSCLCTFLALLSIQYI